MNNKKTDSWYAVFVLSVFCLFTICSLFLVLIGANVYRGVVDNMDSNNEIRASLSYVSNKVHAAGGDVSLQTIDGQQALVMEETYDHIPYRTYIYQYDGYLMELFADAGRKFTPGDGDRITPISRFSMSQRGNMLDLTATDRNHRTLTMDLVLHR